MAEKKIQRKWLRVGAVIYGVTLLNGLRFVRDLPAWVIATGIGVNLFMFIGFLMLYKSSAPR
ncbi:MAG TPA: hypothetical protein VJN89_20880 [Candidatus Acidoferrum sp.]|nr:hypothetical protein [Candidatus Acidoferrum sp.]